ncbi:hypothetical protein [Methylobacterium radiotolerans]|uniref:hypothetical protein n=1 Tax=Methylobacterium radiotolerans TaxID=31998 RepID=UPI0015F470E0|nr:hypothetical protein [Methylobacterium radiotolerans]
MATTSYKTAILAGLALAASATVSGPAEARGFGHGRFGHHGGFHHGFHHGGFHHGFRDRFGGRGWWSPTGGYAANSDLGDCCLTVSLVRRRYGRLCR